MKSVQTIKRKVNRRYMYAEFIKQLIRSENDDIQKLLLIKYLLHYNCTHITGRYSDSYLEREIIRLGRKHVCFLPYQRPEKNTVLMVMTGAASIGGHTGLVNNWISFDSSRTYSVVLTNYSQIPDFLENSVKKSGGRITILHGKNDYARAERLLQISQRFEKIVLFTHMYDVVPLMAYSNVNWRIPIYFYRHANFLFSVGLAISDCLLTLCEYDLKKTIYCTGASNVERLDFPTNVIAAEPELLQMNKSDIKVSIREQYGLADMERLIISMGDDFKFKKIVGYDFQEFVIQLLEKAPADVYFLIIGADKNAERWKKLERKTKGHGVAVGRLERNEVSRLLYAADIFVTSFPMEASGAEEAWMYGVPVFNLNITNRLKGYYNDKTCYRDVEHMSKDILKTLDFPDSYEITELMSKSTHDSKEDWLNDLDNIFAVERVHKIHMFKPRKVIGKEEVINAQLLNKMNLYPFQDLDYMKLRDKYKIILRILEHIWGK